jgi:hypothetical protein
MSNNGIVLSPKAEEEVRHDAETFCIDCEAVSLHSLKK